MSIDALIDKQDNVEVIRDQIAEILALETANQQVLATNAAKDPDDWKLRVFKERSNPVEAFLNDDAVDIDDSPVINVWFDTETFDPGASNISERQKAKGTFNIDCYGYGVSESDGAGHKPGDREAALEAQRAVRLVRNILMADIYTYLGLQGLVWQRWPQSVTAFQPQLDSNTTQQVQAVRLAFVVGYNEFGPQQTFDELEFLSIDITQASNGQLLAEADYDFTT